MATTNDASVRARTFDLSIGCGDNGHQLFLAELNPRATLGWLDLPVAGEASIRADVALPGFNWVSIEIFDPIEVIDPGGDPQRIRFRPVEFVLDHGQLDTTMVGGFQFDGSDQDLFPGIESDFDREGRVLRIRVERAGFIGSSTNDG